MTRIHAEKWKIVFQPIPIITATAGILAIPFEAAARIVGLPARVLHYVFPNADEYELRKVFGELPSANHAGRDCVGHRDGSDFGDGESIFSEEISTIENASEGRSNLLRRIVTGPAEDRAV